MAGVNTQTIIGNLGADPELRHAQSGMAVCKLNVAVNERVKKGDAWEEHTEWFRVVCFGNTAESAAKYLTKGRQVYVEGPSRYRTFERDDGTQGATREIMGNRLQFLGSQEQGGQGKPQKAQKPQGAQRPPQQGRPENRAKPGAHPPKPKNDAQSDGFYDDDLPF